MQMTFDLTAGKVKEAMAAAKAASGDLWKVPIDDIHVIDGFNIRSNGADHQEHLTGLVNSILANGFYLSRPLAGYVALKDGKNIVYITDGHCRLEAAKEANKQGAELKTLPVVVSPKGTSLEDLTVGLVTNNSGKPLSPYEIGLVCKRLTGFGWDEKEIAKRLSMTVARVGDLLTLVSAPASVRKLVTAGTVSATQAIDTIKRHGERASEKLEVGAAKAKASGKTKATKKHIEDKPTYRAVVIALLAWAETSTGTRDNELKSLIKMAKESHS